MENAVNPPTARQMPAARLKAQRSAVSNGRRLHVVRPGDTAWARRFRDVLNEICSDLGEGLSEGQRQLARRAATLAIICEQLEGELARGDIIDAEKLEQYGKQCDRLGRCFARLGLKRLAKNVEMTLGQLRQLDNEQRQP